MEKLVPGFLIAMPQLGDPHFHRTVVLLIEHGQGGAMGLVLNRATEVTLQDLANGQSFAVATARAQDHVFMGGPVEPHRGFLLHDSDREVEKQEVAPGLFLSVTVDALQPLLTDTDCRLRFCLGYAGWGAQQLEQEIAAGSWLFTEVAGKEEALSEKTDELWEGTLRAMGVDPAMLLVGKGVN